MAHSRSALKRWRQSLKRHSRNRSVKSATRTLLAKAVSAIGSDVSTAEAAVRNAVSGLDRAAQKGIIHPNAAARSKARILKRYNLAQAGAVAAAAAAAPAAPTETGAEKTNEPPARRRGILSRKEAEPKAPEKKTSARSAKEPTSRGGTSRASTGRSGKAAEEKKPTPRSRAKKTS